MQKSKTLSTYLKRRSRERASHTVATIVNLSNEVPHGVAFSSKPLVEKYDLASSKMADFER